MEANRKFWNDQQKLLREALARPEDHAKAIALFLNQHAMVHPAALGGQAAALGGPPAVTREFDESANNGDFWSFEDEVMEGLTEDSIRCIPPGGEHSIAWTVWHTSRIEDVTMNLLAAGNPQLFLSEGWLERLKVNTCEVGNAMSPEEIAAFSNTVDITALREYRLAVGRRTREIVRELIPGELKRRVEPARLQRVLDEGAVVESTTWLTDYWGGLTVAGLLLMPPTRHPFVHWNEAAHRNAAHVNAARIRRQKR